MTVLDRVPVDRIADQAREIHLGRMLLTAIAAVLYGLGWLASKTFRVVLLAITWSIASMRVGWQDARPQTLPAPTAPYDN